MSSSEACANAIEHSPPDADVSLEILVYPDRLEVHVEGQGEFELPEVAARERVHRGLGLPLMAKLSDHMALYSGPRGGTLVALTFYRTGFRDACTGHRQAEAGVEQQARLLDLSAEAIFTWELEGGIEYWNAGAQRLYGFTAQEAVGRVPHELLMTIHPQPLSEVKATLIRDGEWMGELTHTTKSGEALLVESSQQLVAEEDRLLVLESNRDVSERERAKLALEQREERFRTMAGAIQQLAWMARPDGYIYWYNRRWHEYTGTTPHEMEGWGWQSVHDPDLLPAVLARWRGSIATGEPFDMEFPLRGADGRFRLFLTRVMPQKDASGNVVQWFGPTPTSPTAGGQKKLARETRSASCACSPASAGCGSSRDGGPGW